MAAFSAGLGGADSVCDLPHTLAVGLPDSLARRLARNGQLILLRESHLGFVADPAAGAGAFEALTQALCEMGGRSSRRWRRRRPRRDAGAGRVPARVAESATQLKRDVARLKAPITGVSAHADLAEDRVELAPGAPERERAPLAKARLRRCGSPNRSKPCALSPTPFSKRRARGRRRFSSRSAPSPRIAAASPSCANGWRRAGSSRSMKERPKRPRRRSSG